MIKNMKAITSFCLLFFFTITSTVGQDYMFDMDDLEDGQPDPTYSPYAGEHFPKNVYWGDTHLHTSNSFDAGFVNFNGAGTLYSTGNAFR